MCLGWLQQSDEEEMNATRQMPKEGFEKNRGCTDILCLLLFVVFWIGMFIIAGLGFAVGDPIQLMFPTDYEGNVCGHHRGERNLTGRNYLYFPMDITRSINPTTLFKVKDLGICVVQCPASALNYETYNDLWDYSDELVNSNDTQILQGVICDYENDHLTGTWDGLRHWASGEDGCFLSFLPTTSFTYRCLPDLVAISRNNLIYDINPSVGRALNATVFAGQVLVEGAYELYNAWAVLLICTVICLVLCLVWVFLMRSFVAPVTYATLVLVLVALFGGGGYLTYTGYWWTANEETETDETVGKVILGFGISLLILGVIYVLLLVWLLRRIRFAIQIIKEASKTLLKMPSLIVFPTFTFISVLCLSIYTVAVAVFLASVSKDVTLDPADISNVLTGRLNTNRTLTVSQTDSTYRWLELYHVFGYFWGNAFILAVGYTASAGAVVAYFFSSPTRKRSERFAVIRSLGRVLRYHLGSLAFGSLLVAMIQFLRYLMRKVSKRLKKHTGSSIRWVQRIVNFFLWIVEKIVKYINKNAFIVMCIQGKGFCQSAKRAFLLILENILRVSAVNMIGSFIIFLGKIAITVITSVICYMLLDPRFHAGKVLAPEIQYALLPTLLMAVIAFLICTLFMDVYDTVIDTILMCVCFDQSTNDGFTKPYYMPKGIQRVVNVENKSINKTDNVQLRNK